MTVTRNGKRWRTIAAIAAVFVVAWTAAARAETGLPLPRFVSLRADKVNVRTGPGVRYPIDWVYQRKGLPVEIIAEFDTWRKIRDWEGTEGWVHQSMLTGTRTILVTGGTRTMRRAPSGSAPAVAHAEAGTVGTLEGCREGWCLADIAGYEGWLKIDEIWGAFEEEASE
jgi:SH3-like domain-containing protein